MAVSIGWLWDKVKKPVVPIATAAGGYLAATEPGEVSGTIGMAASIAGLTKILIWFIGTKPDGSDKLSARYKGLLAIIVAFGVVTAFPGVPVWSEAWFHKCVYFAMAAGAGYGWGKSIALNR